VIRPRPLALAAAAMMVACIALLALSSSAFGARAAKGFQDDETINRTDLTQDQRNTFVGDIRNLGGSFLKYTINWRTIAPVKPVAPTNPDDPAYVWAKTDAAVDAAQANGLSVLATIHYVPVWAGTPRVGGFDALPDRASDFADFVQAFAARYSRRNPGVIKWVEVWNEPNGDIFGGRQSKRTPVKYAQMVDAAFAAVRRGGLPAKILAGATQPVGKGNYQQTKPIDFFERMKLPNGKRPRFDQISMHPYVSSKVVGTFIRPKCLLKRYKFCRAEADLGLWPRAAKEVRKLLGNKPLWVTEFAVLTHANTYNNFAFTPAQQPRVLKAAFKRLRNVPNLVGIAYYQLVDQKATSDAPKYNISWESGVYFWDLRKKPGYSVFRAL
jgi:hypothetical protein